MYQTYMQGTDDLSSCNVCGLYSRGQSCVCATLPTAPGHLPHGPCHFDFRVTGAQREAACCAQVVGHLHHDQGHTCHCKTMDLLAKKRISVICICKVYHTSLKHETFFQCYNCEIE